MPSGHVARTLLEHDAPLLLEVHPPNRPQPDELYAATGELLAPVSSVPVAA